MTNNEEEKTVREATLTVLAATGDGIKDILELCRKSAEDFDQGRHMDALNRIHEEMIPRIADFSDFSLRLVEGYPKVLGDKLIEAMASGFEILEKSMKKLDETSNEMNFKDAALALRTGIIPVLEHMPALFRLVSEAVRTAADPDLDKF